MSFTIILLMLIIVAVLGMIIGVFRKNMLMIIILGAIFTAIICVALFMIFVLIPSM